MVVKMVVRPIAKLIKWHARVQAAHCFGIAGRDERDCGSPGVESVQRQLLPSKCNAVTRLVRAYAISGSATRSSRTSAVNRSRSEPSR